MGLITVCFPSFPFLRLMGVVLMNIGGVVCQCNGASAVCSVPPATSTATGVTAPTATGNGSQPIASAVVVGEGAKERARMAFVVGLVGTFFVFEMV